MKTSLKEGIERLTTLFIYECDLHKIDLKMVMDQIYDAVVNNRAVECEKAY